MLTTKINKKTNIKTSNVLFVSGGNILKIKLNIYKNEKKKIPIYFFIILTLITIN
jgi:hypothetical protein